MVSIPALNRIVRAARFGVFPTDPPRTHASGPAPYRMLAIGGDLLAGAGVATHDLALTGCLARAVAGLVGHGVDVETVVSDLPPSRLEQEVRGTSLARYDALVLVVCGGANERAGDGIDATFTRMLTRLRARMAPGSPLVVVGAPTGLRPVGSASVFTHRLEVLLACAQPMATVVRLRTDLPLSISQVERNSVWAAQIATAVTPKLVEPLVLTAQLEELEEVARRSALSRMGPVDARGEQALRRIASFASAAYGTEFAAVAIAGDSLMHFVVRRGTGPDRVPRAETICETALRTYGGIIVGDVRTDPRFAGSDAIKSGSARFYAGHRIEGADGTPIGVLCVWDPEPRRALLQDLDVLRDFAHGAEAKLRVLAAGFAEQPRTSGRRATDMAWLA